VQAELIGQLYSSMVEKNLVKARMEAAAAGAWEASKVSAGTPRNRE